MSRAARLLQLMQALRRRRHPVPGAVLAQELGISLRTLYRDIATLQQQGACIEGEPGLGYVLRPGFVLPPLMFAHEEVHALALGARWVAERGDTYLADAARNALAKIAAVLPADLRLELETSALLIGPGKMLAASDATMAQIRQAIHNERRMCMRYGDEHGHISERVVWPCALGYFDRVSMLVAWCELRQGFRHFRTDRIEALQVLPERYAQRRQALLKRWRQEQGITADRN